MGSAGQGVDVARRGRKPKPTALKILDGTRADRVNQGEPRVPTGTPDAPEILDPVARAEWDRIVALLAGSGVLSRVDGAALTLYCQTFSHWVEAEKSLQAKGLLIETPEGALRPSPYMGISQKAVETMHRLLVEFGLTPSSRSRIKSTAEPAKDALGEFLARRSK